MRIVLVNKYAHVTGGADLHCLELAGGLRERGHDVAFLSTSGAANEMGAFIAPTVTHASRGDLSPIVAGRVAAQAFWNRSAAAAMRRLCERIRPDVVHAHKIYPQLSVAPLWEARRLGVPVVQTLHDYELMSASALDANGGYIDQGEERLQFRALNTATFAVRRLVHTRLVAAWITVSRFVAERYRNHGISPRVLPNFTEPVRDCAGFNERSGVVFVGRLTPEKGVQDVIDVARALPGLDVTVAGDGPMRQDMERAAAALPNLTYRGRLPGQAVRELLCGARVAFMPSTWHDPGPLASLEAMAAGTPLVVYERGGLTEYVTNADAGVVIAPDVRRAAAAIDGLANDADTWCRFSRNGTAAAAGAHSLPRYLDELLPIYEEVASR